MDEGTAECSQPPDQTDFYHQRFIAVGAASDEEVEERKALDFHESDPAFRTFVCNYPITPVFLVVSAVKTLILIAALSFTIAQLIIHSTSSISDQVWNRTIESPSATPKTSGDDDGARSSWASAIFYFEPSWWLVLAYLRLTVTVVAISSVVCGLFGLWTQRRRFLLATAAADCGLILLMLGYLVLLAWHAVRYGDYFAFCIGGLTVLLLLLISVMALHAAVVTRKYLRSIRAYLNAAKARWPDAYEEAVRVVRRRSEERTGFVSNVYDCLARRYAVVRELSRVTSSELKVMNRPKNILHDIEEDEHEDGDEQRPL